MIYPKIPLAQHIIEILSKFEIFQIVISPGSRNAPLTIGFSADERFECFSIADERCAGFFALGMAQQTQKPVVLLCTSGSALLNYYPAFSEAFYSQIPLIVISADRPVSKIDIGDGQTIRQANVFANHSLFNANLDESACPENDKLICQAIQKCISQKGPVHINAPFEEPLYETVSEKDSVAFIDFETEIKQEIPILDSDSISSLKSKKIMVLVGELFPDSVSTSVLDFLASQSNIVVLTEWSSNMHHKDFIANIDTLITPFDENDFEQFRPDLLITFGGMIVSKRIKTFLRNYKPNQHWHIDTLRAYDVFGVLTKHIVCNPNDFFEKNISNFPIVSSDYKQDLLFLMQNRKERRLDFFQNSPFSDFKVYGQILNNLPKKTMLQISNSAAIRYLQLFDVEPSVKVFCNRGTSGIDGSTSTAIGASVKSNLPTIFITGDISFFYDSNALWNDYIPNNFKLILINNRGGGIFRILPGHKKNETFAKYFETQHQLDASHLSKMYGFEYFVSNDEASLKSGINDLLNAQKPSILEIFTPTDVNDEVLKSFFQFLRE